MGDLLNGNETELKECGFRRLPRAFIGGGKLNKLGMVEMVKMVEMKVEVVGLEKEVEMVGVKSCSEAAAACFRLLAPMFISLTRKFIVVQRRCPTEKT
ncbi:unnamed protein product [Brassica oleracea var. botrytis]|uniref:Uncharacterized protein n=2 Tax=Brassica oleracea TaxID=3712 RepID=A0A0D3B661_BRAOL|nr:unnamed protein product [Brassica oleracea]